MKYNSSRISIFSIQTITGFIFFCVGVFLFYKIFIPLFNDWNHFSSTITVPAKVLYVKLNENDNGDSVTYNIKIKYEYIYNDKKYIGIRASIHKGSDNFGDYYNKLYARLKTAKDKNEFVECYINPKYPHISVLDKKIRLSWLIFTLLFGMGWPIFSLYILITGIRKLNPPDDLLKYANIRVVKEINSYTIYYKESAYLRKLFVFLISIIIGEAMLIAGLGIEHDMSFEVIKEKILSNLLFAVFFIAPIILFIRIIYKIIKYFFLINNIRFDKSNNVIYFNNIKKYNFRDVKEIQLITESNSEREETYEIYLLFSNNEKIFIEDNKYDYVINKIAGDLSEVLNLTITYKDK